MATHPNTHKKHERQRRFLAYIAQDMTIAAACREMPMPRQSYERWMKDDPDFRFTMEQIRNSPGKEGYTGDFVSFRKEFFGWETYAAQQEIVRAIEGTQPGEIALVLVPPEHGKTTIIEDWCCKKLGEDPNHRIAYGSEGLSHVRKINGRLRRRMTDSQVGREYIMRFGPFYVDGQERQGKPWGSDYFTVWKADHDERDYSFESKGWRSAIAGTRTDTMILDDIQSARSINLSEKMLNVLQQDWFTRPGKTGRIIIIGTRVGVGDVYQLMLDEGLIDRLVILPAIRDNGEALIPELYSLEELARKRKKVGEAVWWRNYMQKPRQAIDATFTDEMVDDAANISRHLGEIPEWMADRIMMLDPAIVGGNALVAAGYNSERFGVLNCALHRNIGSAERILIGIEDFAIRYRPSHLIIEVNAYQKALKEDQRLKALSAKYGFRVVSHTTGLNKQDEMLGVARMALGFIAKQIEYPYADEKAQLAMTSLREELLNWRPDVNPRKHRMDLVMALWFGWLWWERMRKRLEAGHTAVIQTKALPWAPTSLTRLGRAS